MGNIPIQNQQIGPGFAHSDFPRLPKDFVHPLTGIGRAMDAAGAMAEGYLTEIANKEAAAKGLNELMKFKAGQQGMMEKLQASAASPDGFTPVALKAYDQEAQKFLKGIENPRVAQFVQGRLQEDRANFAFSSLKWESDTRLKLRDQTLNETLQGFGHIVGNDATAYTSAKTDIEGAIGAAGYDIAEAGALKKKAFADLANSAVYGLINRDPSKAMRLLNGGAFDEDLPFERKTVALNHAEGELKRRDNEARMEANATSGATASSLAVDINRFRNGQGDFNQTMLDGMAGKVNVQDLNRLQMAFDDARAFRSKAEEGVLSIGAKIETGQHIDPGNAQERKAYDQYFTQSVAPRIQEEVSKLPAEDRNQAYAQRVISFIGKQGVVPESLKGQVRGSLRSGSPAAKLEAAQMLDQLKAVNPQVLNDFDASDIRAGNLIGAYVDSGMKPEDAVRTAEEVLRRPADVSQELDRRYSADVKDNSTADWLAGQMSGWWSSPTVGPVVSTEVARVVRAEYQRNGGSLEAARRTALDQVKARFGPTSINGSFEVMRNPPERHYGVQWLSPDENAQRIRQEALTDITTGGATDGQLTTDNIKILPFPVRGVSAPDGRPAYSISVQDTAGNWTVQMDMDPKSPTFGLPRPWWPSMGQVKQERQQEVDDAVKGARAKRGGKGGPLDGKLKGSRSFDLPKALQSIPEGSTFTDPTFGELRRQGNQLVPVEQVQPGEADRQPVNDAGAMTEAEFLDTKGADISTAQRIDPEAASKFLVEKGKQGAKLGSLEKVPRWLNDIEQARRQGRYAQQAVEAHYAKEIAGMKRDIARADAKEKKSPVYQAFLSLGLME